VKAKENSVLWVLDRGSFKKAIFESTYANNRMWVPYLNQIPILEVLLQTEKLKLCECLTEMRISMGTQLIQVDETEKCLYILISGSLAVTDFNEKEVVVTAPPQPKEGESLRVCSFGELALLGRGDTSLVTLRCASEEAVIMRLEPTAMSLILAPLSEIIRQSQAGIDFDQDTAATQKSTKKDLSRQLIKRKDLQKVGMLGVGQFGTVGLWQHIISGKTFAMKSISKGYIVQQGLQQLVHNEKNVMLVLDSPFIIKLFQTYSSPESCTFLLEPALGGELYVQYHKNGFHGNQKCAKFYTAGVVLAFEHMHSKQIVYRDLKPENVMIADTGYPKVADFGLAKIVASKTYTTCGTPDYFAPEIIQSSGHSMPADWWALGVFIFECLTGSTPFDAPNPMQTFTKIMNGIDRLYFPPRASGDAEKLIKALCRKEPFDRLPLKAGGTVNLKKCEWYKSFEWERMTECQLEPPFMPALKNKTDISNFSNVEAGQTAPVVPYQDDGTNWDADFAT